MSDSNPLPTAVAAPARDLIPSWPEQAFPLQDVQTWVASALDLRGVAAVAPVAVYAAYNDAPDQRLTARLAVADGSARPREVVFKGNRFPLLAGSARAHALVSGCCPRRVPRVLAWEDNGGEGEADTAAGIPRMGA